MAVTNITYPVSQDMDVFYQTLKDAITALNLLDAGTIGQVFKKTGTGFLEGAWTEIYEDQTGDIKMTASTTSGSGYLICNGSLKNIVDYPELFAVISNTYGGDGITTFRVPDMRARTAVGAGTLANPDARETLSPATYALGDKFGVSQFIQNVSEMPTHFHSSQGDPGGGGFGFVSVQASNLVSTGGFVSTDSKGGSDPQENRQPSTVVNFKIKT